MIVEKDQQRHDGVASLLRRTLQFPYLAFCQQQLAVALLLMIVIRPVEIRRHRHAAHPHLAVDNQTVGVHQTGLTRTDALNLGTRQDNACRQRLNKEVFERSLLIAYVNRTFLPDLFFLLVHCSIETKFSMCSSM